MVQGEQKQVLDCLEVRKVFPTGLIAVDGASLAITKGECFGLLGPNGAGKSTLINMIYNATSRSGGQMKVLGYDPMVDSRSIKYRLGVVTQENALDEAMTVEENMKIFASFVGVNTAVAAARIDELLNFMNLAHKRKAKISELSGGMQRRLVFVRALLGKPELLILDEPTTGLDPAVRQMLWTKVIDLKRQGTTILLTTHYMDEAEYLCDRLVIMDRGKVCAEGSPKQLIERHCPGAMAIFREDNTLKNLEKAALAQSTQGWSLTKDSTGWRVQANDWPMLNQLIKDYELRPDLMRPSNLEDVFLHLTGRELSQDA